MAEMILPAKCGSWSKSSKCNYLQKIMDSGTESDSELSESSSGSSVSTVLSGSAGEFMNCSDVDISAHSEQYEAAVADSSVEADDCSDPGSVEYDSNWSDQPMSSSDESEAEVTICENSLEQSYTVRDGLKICAVRCNVAHSDLRMLMNLLRPFHNDLPRDPRTVIGGPTKVTTASMGQGTYYNFGLKNMLQNVMRNQQNLPAVLTLDFNIDGLPLSKSSSVQLWPILCRIHQLRKIPPFIVAAYCGPNKPTIHDFLKDFAPELQHLQSETVTMDGKLYEISIGNFICNAPARAYVKGNKGHTGYDGCDRCVQTGKWEGRVTFPEVDAELRTDENFMTDEDSDHVTTGTPLADIEIGMISQFPQDIMHLVYLGIVSKLIRYWTKGALKYRLSANILKLIDANLKMLQKFWPYDFNRKPRAISESDHWKATEARSFVLYLGPIVLKKFLRSDHYELFMLLHIGITILVRSDLHRTMNSLAENLLRRFVLTSKRLLGVKFVSYNGHSVIHLAKDVLKNGPAHSFSAFPFENLLGSLKLAVRGRNKPLQHLIRRTLQQLQIKNSPETKQLEGPIATSRHNHGPTCGLRGNQYGRSYWQNTILSNKKGNNVVVLTDSTVVKIDNFVATKNKVFIVGRKFEKYLDLFTVPVRPSKLGIFRVEKCMKRETAISLNEIRCKALLLPLSMSNKNAQACYPLL